MFVFLDANVLISTTNPGATSLQPTATVLHVSSQHTPTSAPQTGPTASVGILDLESSGQTAPEDDIFPGAQMTDPPEASSHKPEVTTVPAITASASTELTTQATPSSSTANLEATSSNPESKDTETATGTASDPSTSVSPGDLSVPTTHTPSSTAAAVQGGSKDDVTPQGATDDPVRITSDPEADSTSKPQVKPGNPAKPALSESTSKPATKPLNGNDSNDYQSGEKICMIKSFLQSLYD